MRKSLKENWGLNRMERKFTIFNFLTETLVIFSVSIIFITLCTFFFGEDAQGISSLFQLNSEGLSNKTIMQFLLFAFVMEVLSKFWYSGKFAVKMMVLWRTVFLLLSIVVTVAIFSTLFDWFKIDNYEAWIGFFVVFAFFFGMSILVMVIKTKMENKKVEEGLNKYQKERGMIHDK